MSEPKFFLASPSDVRYLRNVALGTIHDVSEGDAPSDDLDVYAWEIDTAEKPFDDLVPAQEQIHRPDDPLCRGVIAFFGEWIGRPLAEDFPLAILDPLDPCREDLAYRLVHPWRPEAVESGGFPLTGSTFEVLAAIAADRRAKEGAPVRSTPLLLRFVGPEKVLHEASVGRAAWGNRRLRRLVQQELEDDDDECDRRRGEIRKQLNQLRNFALFLTHVLGHVANFVQDEEEVEVQIKKWLLSLGLGAARPDRDPFKGLQFYDVADADVFYGRDSDRKEALRTIRQLWDLAERPKWFWVRGVSGAGKSSFLRAGLIGHMIKKSFDRAVFAHRVVRPNQLVLHEGDAERHGPLKRLFQYCLEAVDQSDRESGRRDAVLADRLADFDAVSDEDKPAWAARAVSRAVSGEGRADRFVLGFDQFEEAVDLVCATKTRPVWTSLVEFVVHLSCCPGVLVLATIREDRLGMMSHHPTLVELQRETAQKSCFLGFPGAADLSQVVRKPFAGVPELALDEDLVSTLTDKIRAFSASGSSGIDQGSLLPLVSLTLERLYRDVALPLIEKHKNLAQANDDTNDQADGDRLGAVKAQFQFKRVAGSKSSSQPMALLTVAKAEGYLDIEKAITALAEAAVDEARDVSGPNWEDTAIDDLLRRLVAWTGSEEQRVRLPAADWPEGRAPGALARAMQSRRLIVPEAGDQIRLVHEAVIDHWSAARSWLEFETPLFSEIGQLQNFTAIWVKDTSDQRVLELGSYFYVPHAARLLALWHDILVKLPRDPDPENKAALRDFCLALLAHHNKAGEHVERTPRRPTHLHLVAAYNDVDAARKMLAAAPEAVDLTRRDARTALFYPAFQGQLEMAELLLKHGADADAADEKKWRPIHAASVKGSVEVVEALVSAGAELGAGGAPGDTAPIHLAAANGRVGLIDYFVRERKVDVDLRDKQGMTPIMRAGCADQAAAVRQLVALGGSAGATLRPDLDNEFGWTALHLAARDGATDAIDALIDAGLAPNGALVNGATALHLAAHNGNAEGSRRLIAKSADVEARALVDWQSSAEKVASLLENRTNTTPSSSNGKFDFTPLHMAAAAGHGEVAALLLKHKAKANAVTGSGATPLHLAATNDKHELAGLLLAEGAATDLRDASGNTPFHEALRARAFNTARALLKAGVAGDAPVRLDRVTDETKKVTPLHKAASEGEEEVVRFLLAQNVSPDVTDWRGWTALHYAAAAGSEQVSNWLIGHEAPVRACDHQGLTPLHLACRAGAASVVARLIEVRSFDWGEDRRSATPLHLAAHAGSEAVIALLLEAGHPVDPRDGDGMTPLHRAVQVAAAESVDRLLASGADPRARAERPRFDSLQLAARVGDTSVIRRLLQARDLAADETHEDGPSAVVLAMRYRQFDAVALLLDSGASMEALDPDSGQSLIESYRHQVARADALNLVGPRSESLESAFLAKGGALGLPDLKEVQQTPGDLESRPSAMSGQPGATAFYWEHTRGAQTVWRSVADKERAAFLERISPVDGKYVLDPEKTEVRYRLLPWYERVSLLSLRNRELDGKGVRLFYLSHDDNIYRLNGTSPPIHEVNAIAPIKLNESNVLEYLRFFCFFVRGQEGPFYIAESADDPLIPKNINATTRGVIEGTIRPAVFEGMNEHGHFLCDAVVFYSNALFIANFALQPTGMLEMLDDEPIAADLPCKIERRLA